jgi:hypothetical protein
LRIVLDALFDPSRGLGGRLVTSILEGATLGGLRHEPWAPITGYLAFGTIILYFLALSLLPHPGEPALPSGDHPALEPGRDIRPR